MTQMLLCSITVSIIIQSFNFIFGNQSDITFSLAVNTSWYEAKNVCALHNATLLIVTSHDDIYTIQRFLMDIVNDELPLPIFLGLNKDHRVRNFIIKLVVPNFCTKLTENM